MTAPLAIGVGCRAGCAGTVVAALVRRAQAACEAGVPARLFTLADKEAEPGLHEAAAMLGLDLVFLPRAALAAVADRTRTPSPASQTRFALPSVSEAAALAGAGPGARLLVPRMASGGATCAVATQEPA